MAALLTSTRRIPILLRRLSHHHHFLNTPNAPQIRSNTTRNEPDPNWRKRVLLYGLDYLHWKIIMEFDQDPKPSEDEMIDNYVKTLAQVVGSEEEAKKKIYSVYTTTYSYTGFGALISKELSEKVKGLPGVSHVVPDSYLDIQHRDYGGDLYINGEVIRRPPNW